MESIAQKVPRVLLVDDDEMFFVALQHNSRRCGIDVDFIYAADMGKGIDQLNATCCDAAVIDVCIPGVTGVTMGQLVRKHDPHIPLAYLTNLDSQAVKEEAEIQRAHFLFKQHYIFTDDGMELLVKIIFNLAQLNPCLNGGVRVDSHGFQRRLPKTPIEIPEPFAVLLNHSRAMSRAA